MAAIRQAYEADRERLQKIKALLVREREREREREMEREGGMIWYVLFYFPGSQEQGDSTVTAKD